jgi:hypothetical protein
MCVSVKSENGNFSIFPTRPLIMGSHDKVKVASLSYLIKLIQ